MSTSCLATASPSITAPATLDRTKNSASSAALRNWLTVLRDFTYTVFRACNRTFDGFQVRLFFINFSLLLDPLILLSFQLFFHSAQLAHLVAEAAPQDP